MTTELVYHSSDYVFKKYDALQAAYYRRNRPGDKRHENGSLGLWVTRGPGVKHAHNYGKLLYQICLCIHPARILEIPVGTLAALRTYEQVVEYSNRIKDYDYLKLNDGDGIARQAIVLNTRIIHQSALIGCKKG